MKIKAKAQDFRVRELLEPEYFKDRGRFRVYCVTKKKLTSMEAAAQLADMAGVAPADVGMAGLKDRQGVTIQFMSVKGGKPVFLKTPELRIEPAGFAAHELSSSSSRGNAFEITVRGLTHSEREQLVRGTAEVKAYGLPNYFGEQRFGNLRHGQGWIARDLAQGRHEMALRMLLAGRSENDDARNTRFKASLDESWGDWRACREIAGRFGQHISVFQHLARHDGDFAGAFRYVKSQIRLIHLYAWQSHLWNRAVAAYVEEITPPGERFVVPSPEGRLVFARGALKFDPSMHGTFRLPGPGLDDVKHPHQRDLLALALREQGLQPHEFRIEGVSGFQLKGEDRPLVVEPRNLRVDEDRSGRTTVSFELPRGAYATLVMARLVPPVQRGDSGRSSPDRAHRSGPRAMRGERGSGFHSKGPRDGARSKGARIEGARGDGARDGRSDERPAPHSGQRPGRKPRPRAGPKT
jgi:tRNA pseudouridine13 synthase